MHKVKYTLLLITNFFVFNPISVLAENDLSIKQVWISEAPPSVSILAAYLTITNNTDKDISLLSVSSPTFKTIEIHRSVEKNGLASMERLENLDIAAGNTISLEPGGYHLMLFDPAKPLKAGDTVQMEFNFTNGNDITAQAVVNKRTGYEHRHH